jgi:diguanylate cyclase (GGDEF)-like protein
MNDQSETDIAKTNIAKTILIVDDTPTNIDILVGILDDYDLLVAQDGKSALDIADEEKIDLILLDIMMPEMDGYEVCRRLKLNHKTKDIPIVFITAKTDEDSIAKAYSAGGVDYVTKPFMPKELLARVKVQLKIHSLIANLEYLSSYDIMTGLYNRRKFFKLGENLFTQSKAQVFAIMIDIDHFKEVNDTYGHATGDTVIKAVGKTIQEKFKNYGTPGRIGGEEFAVISSSPSPKHIYEKIESLRLAISDIRFSSGPHKTFGITISSGVAALEPEHTSIDDLLKDADESLYEAKKSGRNKSIFKKIDPSIIK